VLIFAGIALERLWRRPQPEAAAGRAHVTEADLREAVGRE